MTEIPRRIKFDSLCPAERAIYDAVQAVEAMAADVRLTDAVVLLQAARDSVADYIDNIGPSRRCVSLAEVSSPATPQLPKCVIGEYCRLHQFIHGAEAEELRERFEKLAEDDNTPSFQRRRVRAILDDVDARDSCEMPRLAEVSSPATPRANRFDCRTCGADITVNKDGCCRTCGVVATIILAGKVYSPPVDPHAMVRFSQLDMDAVTKPLHIEIERLKGAASPATPALEQLIDIAHMLDDFQRHYDTMTMNVDRMPGNDLYSGKLMIIVRAAREALADVARLPASQED